jgi:hypothetical protein
MFSFEINNQQTLNAEQFHHDGSISITKYDHNGQQTENTFTISPGDFIQMLNWYRYQKEKGNHALDF